MNTTIRAELEVYLHLFTFTFTGLFALFVFVGVGVGFFGFNPPVVFINTETAATIHIIIIMRVCVILDKRIVTSSTCCLVVEAFVTQTPIISMLVC